MVNHSLVAMSALVHVLFFIVFESGKEGLPASESVRADVTAVLALDGDVLVALQRPSEGCAGSVDAHGVCDCALEGRATHCAFRR
jgi:hypothetical protein